MKIKHNIMLDGYQRSLGAVVSGIGAWMFYAHVGGAIETVLAGITVLMGGSIDNIRKTWKARHS